MATPYARSRTRDKKQVFDVAEGVEAKFEIQDASEQDMSGGQPMSMIQVDGRSMNLILEGQGNINVASGRRVTIKQEPLDDERLSEAKIRQREGERKRRAKLKEQAGRLKGLLPTLKGNSKVNDGIVMEHAANYIEALQRELADLRAQYETKQRESEIFRTKFARARTYVEGLRSQSKFFAIKYRKLCREHKVEEERFPESVVRYFNNNNNANYILACGLSPATYKLPWDYIGEEGVLQAATALDGDGNVRNEFRKILRERVPGLSKLLPDVRTSESGGSGGAYFAGASPTSGPGSPQFQEIFSPGRGASQTAHVQIGGITQKVVIKQEGGFENQQRTIPVNVQQVMGSRTNFAVPVIRVGTPGGGNLIRLNLPQHAIRFNTPGRHQRVDAGKAYQQMQMRAVRQQVPRQMQAQQFQQQNAPRANLQEQQSLVQQQMVQLTIKSEPVEIVDVEGEVAPTDTAVNPDGVGTAESGRVDENDTGLQKRMLVLVNQGEETKDQQDEVVLIETETNAAEGEKESGDLENVAATQVQVKREVEEESSAAMEQDTAQEGEVMEEGEVLEIIRQDHSDTGDQQQTQSAVNDDHCYHQDASAYHPEAAAGYDPFMGPQVNQTYQMVDPSQVQYDPQSQYDPQYQYDPQGEFAQEENEMHEDEADPGPPPMDTMSTPEGVDIHFYKGLNTEFKVPPPPEEKKDDDSSSSDDDDNDDDKERTFGDLLESAGTAEATGGPGGEAQPNLPEQEYVAMNAEILEADYEFSRLHPFFQTPDFFWGNMLEEGFNERVSNLFDGIIDEVKANRAKLEAQEKEQKEEEERTASAKRGGRGRGGRGRGGGSAGGRGAKRKRQ